MSDPWWPSGTNDPAFQTQRQPYGAIVGGDYARARSVIRVSELPPAAEVDASGNPKWHAGSLIVLTTTNHLYEWVTGAWVDKGVYQGGITTLPQTALRYSTQVKGWDALQDRALMAVRPYSHSSMEILWGWPEDLSDSWLEVALVRSAFGRPVTVNDGVTVFRATRDAMLVTFSPDGTALNGPIIYDQPLPGGHWYYYAVFFKTGPLDWVPGYSASSPLPRDYHHAEHLWDALPPWYQYTDDQQKADEGPLREFLRVFGFELDLTREYVEQWQQLYHIDFTPMKLLRRLGENFNVPYESGLGDIRYRGLVGNIAHLYAERGTGVGLEHVIEAASQYQCNVTTGDNVMLTPEDSEFLSGTGRWAAMHPELPPANRPVVTGAYNTSTDTVLAVVDPAAVAPPPGQGRGVMEFHATGSGALPNLAICCGCGVKQVTGPPTYSTVDGKTVVTYPTVDKEILPIYGAIVVARPGVFYGFSVWIKEPVVDVTAVGFMWFGPEGDVESYLDFEEKDPATPAVNTWTQYTIQATAPLGDPEADPPVPAARYMVPYIRLGTAAYEQKVYVAGAVVYEPAKGLASAVPFAPDKYLTMGDPNEKLGIERVAVPKGGSLLGQPGQG